MRRAALEGLANAAAGLVVSWLAVMAIFPAFGWATTPGKSLAVSFCFFVLSWARSTALRMLFARIWESS